MQKVVVIKDSLRNKTLAALRAEMERNLELGQQTGKLPECLARCKQIHDEIRRRLEGRD
jgi:hypothetical protein